MNILRKTLIAILVLPFVALWCLKWLAVAIERYFAAKEFLGDR